METLLTLRLVAHYLLRVPAYRLGPLLQGQNIVVARPLTLAHLTRVLTILQTAAPELIQQEGAPHNIGTMIILLSSAELHHLQGAIRQECDYPLSNNQWHAICLLQATALDEWAPPPALPTDTIPPHAEETSNATRVLCGLVLSTWSALQAWIYDFPPSKWTAVMNHLVTWGILQAEEGPLDMAAAEEAEMAARRALRHLATAERPVLLITLHVTAVNAPLFGGRRVMDLLVAALALAGPMAIGSPDDTW